MFAYNPGVQDRRGEIIGAAATNAAQIESAAMQQAGQDIGGAIASLADSFVQGRQLKAKADGYADFLGMHGESLGVRPEWLEEFKKKSPFERAQLGDMMVQSFLPHAQRMEYLRTQGDMYGRGTGGGSAGGGGGGGAADDYVVGAGWGN